MTSPQPDIPQSTPPRDRWLCRPLAIAAWLCFAATIAGFGGRLWWVFGLFSPLRFHLLLASAAFALVLIAGTRWRRWRVRAALGAAVVSLLINSVLVAPLWIPVERGQPAGQAMTVMTFNLHVGNRRLDQASTVASVASVIEHSGAAIVVVEEITVHRLGVLERSLPGYRRVAGTGRPDAFGIALFVRRSAEQGGDRAELVVESAQEIDVTSGLLAVHQVELRCRWQGRPLSLLGLHTISAIHARSDRSRVAMLAGAATWARNQQREGRAVIVCGDFNATPWCSPFVDLLADATLLDSHRGLGVQGSWPSRLPGPLRIPIDQCLHSVDLVTLRREIGADSAGSDHLPLTVELKWR